MAPKSRRGTPKGNCSLDLRLSAPDEEAAGTCLRSPARFRVGVIATIHGKGIDDCAWVSERGAKARRRSGPFFSDSWTPAIRPMEASKTVVCYVRDTSIRDVQSVGTNMRSGSRRDLFGGSVPRMMEGGSFYDFVEPITVAAQDIGLGHTTLPPVLSGRGPSSPLATHLRQYERRRLHFPPARVASRHRLRVDAPKLAL